MSARPRVLVIASLGPRPFSGGIENVVDTLLHSSLQSDFEFEVLDTFRERDPRRTVWSRLRFSASLFLRTWRVLGRVRPDIVHIHFCSGVDFHKHVICLVVSRLRRRRTVFHLHGGGFQQFHAAHGAVGRMLFRRAFRLPQRVVALSEFWRVFLSGFVEPAKLRVLSNPIDVERLAPTGSRRPDRRSPSILLLGRLGRNKGHFDVLSAAPTVVARHPGVRFLFAGKEDEPGTCERLAAVAADAGIRDRVEFLGLVDFPRKVELLRECSVLILPSYVENMPISLLEGMAAGVPVVGTRVGAVPEVLAGGEVGAMIEAGDHVALAAAINGYLDDPARAEATGQRARARVMESWDIGRFADRLRALYSELLP